MSQPVPPYTPYQDSPKPSTATLPQKSFVLDVCVPATYIFITLLFLLIGKDGIPFDGFLLGIIPAIIVHEFGHAIATWTAGGRVLKFAVLGACLAKRREGWRLVRTSLSPIGFVFFAFDDNPQLPSRVRKAVLGGPLANFGFAILLVGLGILLLPVARLWGLCSLTAAAMSALVAASNLLPSTTRSGYPSDGAFLRALKEKKGELQVRAAIRKGAHRSRRSVEDRS